MKIKRIFDVLSSLTKYLVAEILVHTFKRKLIKENIWLFAERGIDARDNSFALYEYVSSCGNVNAHYVIDEGAVDAYKIKDLVKYKSFEHYLYFCSAKVLISTHVMGYSPDVALFSKLGKYFKLVRGKRIFLDHGIVKDNLLDLHCINNPVDLFVCAAKPEYEYVSKMFGYEEGIVQFLGHPRFDKLHDCTYKRQILLMPTWRKIYSKLSKNEFLSTDYCVEYNKILNDKKLGNILEKNDLQLIFYPHIEFQKFLPCFKTNNKHIKIASFDDYNITDLIKESLMLITDYSSVFFDFAYMKKPVIFFQYDYEIYRREHYSEGYFDYSNSFGIVCSTRSNLNREILQCVRNNFFMNEDKMQIRNEYFTLCDEQNSYRVKKAIDKLVEVRNEK